MSARPTPPRYPAVRGQAYVALDLELEQPSQRVIEVGVVIARPQEAQAAWARRSWLISSDEPLSDFIRELTGISQVEMDAKGVPLAQCCEELCGLLAVTPDLFPNPVVWGGGDSAELRAEFASAGLHFPHFGHRWLDVKTLSTFLRLSQGSLKPGGLASELKAHKLVFEGRPHRALDDAFNTMRLFFLLLERQAAMEQRQWIAQHGELAAQRELAGPPVRREMRPRSFSG